VTFVEGHAPFGVKGKVADVAPPHVAVGRMLVADGLETGEVDALQGPDDLRALLEKELVLAVEGAELFGSEGHCDGIGGRGGGGARHAMKLFVVTDAFANPGIGFDGAFLEEFDDVGIQDQTVAERGDDGVVHGLERCEVFRWFEAPN